MMDNKGGFVEFGIAMGVIILASIIWVILGYGLDVITTSVQPLTNVTIMNMTSNSTIIENNINIANKVYYFSFAFIVIVLLAWVIKKTQEEKGIR